MTPRPRRATRDQRRHRLAVASLVAMVGVGFGQLIVGRPLGGYDVTNYSLPHRVQVADALRHWHLPQWDPFRLAGAPLLANPQSAVLYPPHWLLAWLPVEWAQDLSLVLHVLVAALGVYVFATRVLGASPGGGLGAGATFAYSGFVHAHIGHYEQITSMAWLPWALVAADAVIRAGDLRKATRPAIALAAAIALTALAGHTQYLHMTLVAVTVYSVVASRPLGRSVRVGVALALGLLLAAAQLLPTAKMTGHSLRAGGLALGTAADGSLPLRRAISTFLPRYWSDPPLPVELWAWLPWLGVTLALLGLAAARPQRRVVALLVLAALGGILALGPGTPLFSVAYRFVPGVRFFRVPARWLLLPTLSLALLVAPGIDVVARGVQLHFRRVAVLGVAAALALVGLVTQHETPPVGALLAGAATAALGICAWQSVVARPALSRLGVASILVALGIELLTGNAHSYVRSLRLESGALTSRSAAAKALDDPTNGRVLSVGAETLFDSPAQRRALRPNTHVLDRVRSVDGYDGGLLYTPEWVRAMKDLTRNPHLVGPETARAVIDGRPLDATRLAELDVTRLIVHGPFDVAAMLPSGATSVAEVNDVAVWAVPTYGPVFLTDGTSPDGLRLRRQAARPERLVVEVPPTIAGQTVVVSEAFSPGWSAGEGIGLHRYHDLLMAFTAPAGGGEVALRYRTPGLRLGTLLSGLALIVLISGFVRSRQGSAAARDGPKASSTLES